MTRLYVDGPTVMRAVKAAVANLEAHVEEVDALNVFPVPDGDTGSNMLATMRAALAEAERLPEAGRDLATVADALSRGALTGARGNSGVILSQIIRGMTAGADGRRRANGLNLAEGLRRGSEIAYGAVLTPVEGTILTVIRDAAEAAEAAAGRQPHVEAVLADVIAAAASSVQRTPTLLPVLEDAGVVDSGGQGLYRLLEGTLQVGVDPDLAEAAGADPEDPAGTMVRATHLAQGAAAAHEHANMQGGTAHGYETEYLLASDDGAIDVVALRAAIQATGDSVVVAGDERVARVHVHGERPDLAIAAGLAWGRLSQVAIRDLDEQVSHVGQEASGHGHAATSLAPAVAAGAPLSREAPTDRTSEPAREAPARAVVAVSHADGLATVLGSLGARIVRPGHGTRPSVGEIVAAILAAGSHEVIVLPNDRDAFLAARHAAESTPLVDVVIIPTRNAAEGIAAALAFDPSVSLAEQRERMTREAATLRSFSVTTAARDSVVDGQQVRKGRVIAVDGSRHVLAQADRLETAVVEALSQLGDFDLVTCYHGAGLRADDLDRLRAVIGLGGRGVEVELVAGGQSFEHLLVAVE